MKLKQVDSEPKTSINIRLDTDMVGWFRETYKPGYQSKINEILRKHFKEEA